MSIANYLLTQVNSLIQDLFPIVTTLESDLKKAQSELEKYRPGTQPSNIAFDPAGGVGQYQMLQRQEILENGKDDANGVIGTKEQPENEHALEFKAFRDEFKQALDDKNQFIINELQSLKEEFKIASETHQRSIAQVQAQIDIESQKSAKSFGQVQDMIQEIVKPLDASKSIEEGREGKLHEIKDLLGKDSTTISQVSVKQVQVMEDIDF